jgi:uncharacterized membrane protein
MTDRELEVIVGKLLRTGVLTAALVVTIGGIVYVAHHHSDQVGFHTFQREEEDLRTVPGIVRSAAHLNGESLMQFGLLLLIATPVARVVLAAVGFYLERDHLYTTVSLIVLAVLIFSLLHAT